jgi:hypothetical protein
VLSWFLGGENGQPMASMRLFNATPGALDGAFPL